MNKKCLKCGKVAILSYIKNWSKHQERVGEVFGWDRVEEPDVEIHLCQEHGALFDESTNFRAEMVAKIDEKNAASSAALEKIRRECPVATPDKNYDYHCVDCGEGLRGFYSNVDGTSIGLQCPKCGKVHSFPH